MQLFRIRILFISAILAAMQLILPMTLSSQPIWVDDNRRNSIAIDVFLPEKKKYGYGHLSGQILCLMLNYQFNDRISIISEIPFAQTTYEYTIYHYSGSQKESFVGNPYVGFEIHSMTSRFSTEIGIGVPLTSVDKVDRPFFSIYSNFDWWEVYFSDILSLRGLIKYRSTRDSIFALRCFGGPAVFWDSDKTLEDDVELLLEYGCAAGLESEMFSLLGCLTGSAIITESNIGFGERTCHYFGFTANAQFGKLNSGIYFRKPLDKGPTQPKTLVIGCYFSIAF